MNTAGKLASTWSILFFALVVIPLQSSADNLTTCLDGRYPALCDKSKLTQSQLQRIRDAEHKANLQSCLDGRYPVLCRHGDLVGEEINEVKKAELAANLSACMDGRYPALCRHADLSKEEALHVRQAEHRENLAVCLDGRYPNLCRHGDLTMEESSQVKNAEEVQKAVSQPTAHRQLPTHRPRARSSDCEDGHWIESVMDDGSIIKLEDGSIWKVDDVDTVDSALWLPVTDVIICDGKIINTDDNETVQATRIH